MVLHKSELDGHSELLLSSNISIRPSTKALRAQYYQFGDLDKKAPIYIIWNLWALKCGVVLLLCRVCIFYNQKCTST